MVKGKYRGKHPDRVREFWGAKPDPATGARYYYAKTNAGAKYRWNLKASNGMGPKFGTDIDWSKHEKVSEETGMSDAIRKIIKGCMEADRVALEEAVGEVLVERSLESVYNQDEIWAAQRAAGEATKSGTPRGNTKNPGGVNDPSSATSYERTLDVIGKAARAIKSRMKGLPLPKQATEEVELDEVQKSENMKKAIKKAWGYRKRMRDLDKDWDADPSGRKHQSAFKNYHKVRGYADAERREKGVGKNYREGFEVIDEANVSAILHLKDGNTYLHKTGTPALILSKAEDAGWYNVRFKSGPMSKVSGEDFIVAGKVYQVDWNSPKGRT